MKRQETNCIDWISTARMAFAIGCAIICVAQSSMGLEPGLTRPPQEIADRLKTERPYSEGELAKRIQQIKQERLTSMQNGLPLAPKTMNLAIPILMGNYSDNAHIFTASDFQTLLFGANPTRSMTDYYDEVSYNQLHVTGTVYGPYTAAENQAYYVSGRWGMGSYPRNNVGFMVSLLYQADPTIDFRQYDNDGPDGVPNSGDDDGFVDAFIAMYPDGCPATPPRQGGDPDNMAVNTASFAEYLGQPYNTNDIGANGTNIKINSYVILCAEMWDGTTNEILPIGAFCHEFAHLLGLPDLYDYDRDSWGVGNWCLMGLGNMGATWYWTTSGTPTHMSAWCKEYMGWLTPTVITKAQTLEISPVENTPAVYKVWEDGYQGGRYWLIENRTKTGFDKDLPGEGLLIWHCNEDACYDNSDNGFRLVDLEEADGLNFLDQTLVWGAGPTAGAIYPGPTNNTRFDDASNPSALDVYGNPTNLAIYDIAYVSGSGSPVRVTIKPRVLYGTTISYHETSCDYFYSYNIASVIGYGASGTGHGAIRMTSPIAGTLVAVRAVAKGVHSVGFTINVFDDIVGGVPQGFHTSASAGFGLYRNPRYLHVPLSEPVPLTLGQTFVLDGIWGNETAPVPVTDRKPISGQSYYSSDGNSFAPLTNLDVAMRAVIRFPCIDSLSPDDDNDGLADRCDNCPNIANADQADADDDGIGDLCDDCFDSDHDGFGNPGYPANACSVDNCPSISNPTQADANHDGIGDACCCVGVRGNVNYIGIVDLSDLSALVSYLTGGGYVLPCPNESNINGIGIVDLSDLSALVSYLTGGGYVLPNCL